MNIYIDLDKVSNTILDILVAKMRFIDPDIKLSDKNRKEIILLIKEYYNVDPEDLADTLENLLVHNFNKKVDPEIAGFVKLFRGEN
ncbi:hypothetical protein C5L30_000256 [Companilactobacillus farciminis]|jgi:septum formation topological specificity factor MinE|uniref:Uncharacterized protein n=1 Tax=Companilactobacillus farciminis TaxID=1612 RepID=A0A4R5NJS3_9LACO|nr:hypothetical protein [Companilactobacillus farciminis]ATO46093.1 hypothetical protein LF20184_04695 [Companilactobacillus farciminis KCTC 3681 = DSM 20184]KRK62478.1 hypothetical protein FC68_GL002005 [Companilactobacillus farciminis KCTC 3681 = DSM 20184]TDG74540.1 hypothetical protein C5L30_000256 [Companilactobacillus farciminis]